MSSIQAGVDIPVSQVHVGLLFPNIRSPGSEGNIEELAASILQNGLMHPPVVLADASDPNVYHLVAGHRRLAAIKKILETDPQYFDDANGVAMLPVSVYTGSVTEAEFMNVQENLHRQSVLVVDVCAFVHRKIAESIPTEALAKLLEVSHDTITRYWNFWEKAELSLKDLLREERIPWMVAYELATRFSLEDQKKKVALVKKHGDRVLGTAASIRAEGSGSNVVPTKKIRSAMIGTAIDTQSQYAEGVADGLRFANGELSQDEIVERIRSANTNPNTDGVDTPDE